MRRSHAAEPVLITSAPESSDDEYDRRRKRYAIMMTCRALCVIAAACVYRYSLWIALVAVVGGAILPWCAVILANDRPPKKRQHATVYGVHSGEKALPPGSDGRVVDG